MPSHKTGKATLGIIDVRDGFELGAPAIFAAQQFMVPIGVNVIDEPAGSYWERIGKPHAAVVILQIDGEVFRSGYRFTGATRDDARTKAFAMFAGEPQWSNHLFIRGMAARLIGQRLTSIATALPQS